MSLRTANIRVCDRRPLLVWARCPLLYTPRKSLPWMMRSASRSMRNVPLLQVRTCDIWKTPPPGVSFPISCPTWNVAALLQVDRQLNRYDPHPVVRGVAARWCADRGDWAEAQDSLRDAVRMAREIGQTEPGINHLGYTHADSKSAALKSVSVRLRPRAPIACRKRDWRRCASILLALWRRIFDKPSANVRLGAFRW